MIQNWHYFIWAIVLFGFSCCLPVFSKLMSHKNRWAYFLVDLTLTITALVLCVASFEEWWLGLCLTLFVMTALEVAMNVVSPHLANYLSYDWDEEEETS